MGEDRLAWLRGLPLKQEHGLLALVHASPGNLWQAPAAAASDAELSSVYAPLGRRIAVYAHIHCPFVRTMAALTVANTGSAGLPYDGDRRSAYLLLDDFVPNIRRVEYDVDRESRLLAASGIPHAVWAQRTLAAASFQMP